jgi:hypothetical protein
VAAEAEVPPRVRFAKAQIQRALTALERVDPDALSEGIRTLELEDRISELRQDVQRQRERGDALARLLCASGDERAKLLDEALRVWAAG